MEQSATDKLKEILGRVPEDGHENFAEIFANDLTDNFYQGEYMLLPLPGLVFSKELALQNEVKLLVFHTREMGIPYMAHLIKTQDGWKLKSFMCQCLCCFGLGTTKIIKFPYYEPCNCCGGKGWGSSAF